MGDLLDRVTLLFVLAGFGLGFGCALHALMHKTREASATIAWILVCVELPWIGGILYLLVGQDRVVQRRAFKISVASAVFRARQAGRRAALHEAHARGEPGDLPAAAPIRAITGAPLLGGNAIELHVGGDVAYPPMLEAIGSARRSICLQTYIFDDDGVGAEFAERLAERARAGLEVKVLYDAVGSYATEEAFWSGLRRAGARVVPFMPLRPLLRRRQINLRNHRKVLVVDETTAFTGSLNVSRRHLRSRHPYSHDVGAKVTGPVAAVLQQSFDRSWFFAQGEEPPATRGHVPVTTEGKELVQVVESGPDLPTGRLYHVLQHVLHRAARSIRIVTPYFVPHPTVRDALEIAARRGVEVDLVVPAESDHRLVGLAMRAHLQPLLEAGVRVYERQGCLLHMKLAVIDGLISIFGSSNVDNRSHFLNFELDYVVHGEDFARTVQDVIDAEIAGSRLVSVLREIETPLHHRIAIRVASLFSPVL